jgi:hypothetical protein
MSILVLFVASGEMNYVRGCINQIEAVRPEMPTVRENGCWTATDNYVVRIDRRLSSLINRTIVPIFPLGSCLCTLVCAN